MMQMFKKQWFLMALTAVFLSVTLDPTGLLVRLGLFLKSFHAPQFMIFLIFIFSGLLIDSRQILDGIKDLPATLAALSIILIVAPLVVLLAGKLLPLSPGILVGFYIVAVMPTTLSSGIVMTGAAGGNMAHALFITIVSNFICIGTIPIVLPFLLGGLENADTLQIDRMGILVKLVLIVLIPLCVGMILKTRASVSARIPEKKLQLINQWMIITIVFISLAGSQEVLVRNSSAFFTISLLAACFHLCLLGASFFMVSLMGIPAGRRESVVFMGSQKTLALAATIQVTYFGQYTMALLVCVLHHIIHLMMDGYLSGRMQNAKRN